MSANRQLYGRIRKQLSTGEESCSGRQRSAALVPMLPGQKIASAPLFTAAPTSVARLLVQLLTLLMFTPCVTAAALPGLHHGWNTSIGNESDRLAAAKHFNFTVVDDELLWRNNSLTPFVGKTLRATKVKVIKRNLYSTVIEWYINHNNVHWTVSPGPQGIAGDTIEGIDTTYIRRFSTAGWASPTSWLESDLTKNLPPLPLPITIPIPGGGLTDWGVVEVISSSETSFVTHWRSYQKGEIVITWDLQEEKLLKTVGAVCDAMTTKGPLEVYCQELKDVNIDESIGCGAGASFTFKEILDAKDTQAAYDAVGARCESSAPAGPKRRLKGGRGLAAGWNTNYGWCSMDLAFLAAQAGIGSALDTANYCNASHIEAEWGGGTAISSCCIAHDKCLTCDSADRTCKGKDGTGGMHKLGHSNGGGCDKTLGSCAWNTSCCRRCDRGIGLCCDWDKCGIKAAIKITVGGGNLHHKKDCTSWSSETGSWVGRRT